MINISKPTRTLYPQLIVLWEASVRASHDFLEEEDIAYYRERILNKYFDLVELYMATDKDEKLLGFLGLLPTKIEMLFIDPLMRKMGIGSLLVDYAITYHNVSQVDVNEQNLQAVGFYQKMGFRVIKRNPWDGEGKPYPILVMQL